MQQQRHEREPQVGPGRSLLRASGGPRSISIEGGNNDGNSSERACSSSGREEDGRTEGGSGDDAATARDRITRFSSTMMLSGGGDVENTTDRGER